MRPGRVDCAAERSIELGELKNIAVGESGIRPVGAQAAAAQGQTVEIGLKWPEAPATERHCPRSGQRTVK